MIYLKESFNLHPASPATRDKFVEAVEGRWLPTASENGARLVGGFFAHEEWFSQIVHVTEFEDLAALASYREASQGNSASSALAGATAILAALCAGRHSELLEPLGPVPAAKLHEAIDASSTEPVGTYTFAILEVTEGSMDRFSALLSQAASALPIVAAWNDVSGNPNRVIDLWKGDMGRHSYAPTSKEQDAFFEPLREIAPREKMMRLHPMPYSPLQ